MQPEERTEMPRRVSRKTLLRENEQLWSTLEDMYDELRDLLGLNPADLRRLVKAQSRIPAKESGRARQTSRPTGKDTPA